MAKSATTTFDISKVSPEVLEGPATWNQIKGISYHFGKTGFSLKGKVDREKQAQITGCLYSDPRGFGSSGSLWHIIVDQS